MLCQFANRKVHKDLALLSPAAEAQVSPFSDRY